MRLNYKAIKPYSEWRKKVKGKSRSKMAKKIVRSAIKSEIRKARIAENSGKAEQRLGAGVLIELKNQARSSIFGGKRR